MGLDILRGAVVLGVAWVSWVILQKITAKSPLDNIPGPRPKKFSFLGEFLSAMDLHDGCWMLTNGSNFPGDIEDFFGRHAWPFHKRIWDEFAGVARINSMLGVCCHALRLHSETCIYRSS